MKRIGQLGDIEVSVYKNSNNPATVFISKLRARHSITTRADNIGALIKLLAEAADLNVVITEKSE